MCVSGNLRYEMKRAIFAENIAESFFCHPDESQDPLDSGSEAGMTEKLEFHNALNNLKEMWGEKEKEFESLSDLLPAMPTPIVIGGE